MMRFGFLLVSAFGLAVSCRPAREPVAELVGFAEDLWSERINLADLNNGVTIIHPLSPAT